MVRRGVSEEDAIIEETAEVVIDEAPHRIFIQLEPGITEKSLEVNTTNDAGGEAIERNDIPLDVKPRDYAGLQKKESVPCTICHKTFGYMSRLKLHMRVHTGEKPFGCSMCNFTASYKKSVEIHMRSHTGEKPYACSICDFRAAQKVSVDDHMRVHTGERPYACPLCTFRSAQQSNVRSHMKVHSNDKPHKCAMCNFKTAYKQILDAHTRIHTGERPFPCSLCEYRGTTKHNVKLHMRKHTGEKPFGCPLCNFRSTKRYHVKLHMRRHTGEKPYACTFCSYTASQKQCLLIHMRRHTGEKPFGCTLCDYHASHKKTLQSHMKSHESKFISCPNCMINFDNKANYKDHLKDLHEFSDDAIHNIMETHTNQFAIEPEKKQSQKKIELKKILRCIYCDYQTTYKQNLNIHIKTHIKAKPFACTKCEDRFSYKRELIKHQKVHKKKRIYVCPFCTSNYLEKRKLINHLTKVHYVTNNINEGETSENESDEGNIMSPPRNIFVEENGNDIKPVIIKQEFLQPAQSSSVRNVVFKGEDGNVIVTKRIVICTPN